MPFAVGDDDGDLALALGERVPAGVEMRSERADRFRQLGVVHPDLPRPAQWAARLDQLVVARLLLRRHPVVRDLGIAAEGWRLGHFGSPPGLCLADILDGCTYRVEPETSPHDLGASID